MRGQFSGEPLDDATLAKVLLAAHAAPSVGLSQPWDFVVVTDESTPDLERAGWRARLELSAVCHRERWGNRDG